MALCFESRLICHHSDPWQLFIDALGPDDKMMNREEVITRTLEMHHRYALSTGSAVEQLDRRVILLIVFRPVKGKKKSFWPEFARLPSLNSVQTRKQKQREQFICAWRVIICATSYFCSPSLSQSCCRFMWGYRCPRLNSVCVRQPVCSASHN